MPSPDLAATRGKEVEEFKVQELIAEER